MIHRFGFIAIDRSNIEININQRACAAMLSLKGEQLEALVIDEIFLSAIDPQLICENILNNPKSKLLAFGVTDWYCDEENKDLLKKAWLEVSSKVRFALPIPRKIILEPTKQAKISFPTLRSITRDKDLLVRQQSILSPLNRTNQLLPAKHIKDQPIIMGSLSRLGKSIIADAVAGCATVALKQRVLILANRGTTEEDEQAKLADMLYKRYAIR